MTGLGDIGRIDGDGFSFACEMLADDRGVERKPVESFIFKPEFWIRNRSKN